MANDDFILDDLENVPADQQESEEDVSAKPETVSEAVLFNTDWTVETICRQIEKGNFNLEPNFQRREAWDRTRQSRLIESVICNFPIPNIVLAEDNSRKGRYLVIDGKQRLFSLVAFMKDKLDLYGLPIRKDLNGKNYSAILKEFPETIDTIENSPIRTVIIRHWPDEDYLYTVFYRLNSGSLPLSSQELRKALHGGKLLDYIDGYIKKSAPFITIFGDKLDRRMRDVELVLRYIAFESSYNTYTGNLKKFLDETVTRYDKEREIEEVDNYLARLDVALTHAHEIFGDDAFKKWNGENFEKRINRAVFDVVTRFFSDKEITELLLGHKVRIIEKFKEVCGVELFKNAIEKTTKTPKAVKDRHTLWGKALAEIISKRLDEENMRLQ